MITKHTCPSHTALGSLTAAVALMVGVSAAQAQAPSPAPPLSGAGSFPQSFVVPGTNTSLHVGGFIQLNTYYDMSAFGNSASPGAADNLYPTSIELTGPGLSATNTHTDHGVWRWTAQYTRFSVETRTPTSYGEIKTFIEIDFAGNQSISGVDGLASAPSASTQTNFNQTSVARLKQAYGTMGPWLFGMTNSNFADLAAWADMLDAPNEAGGFMGVASVKQPQVRYTYLLPAGISASGSLEANQSAGILATAGTGAGAAPFNDFNAPAFGEKYPAVTGTVRMDQPWGHAGFHAVVAEERFKNVGLTAGPAFPPTSVTTGLSTGAHESRWGYQISQTGHLNTIGRDKFTWQLQYGQGAANYTLGLNETAAQWEEGLVCSVTTVGGTSIVGGAGAGAGIVCSEPRVMGVNVGYSHYWTDEWRSALSAGYDQVSRPNAASSWGAGGLAVGTANGLASLERKHYSGAANLMWTPIAGTQFGVEYEWYHRTVWSGAHGSSNRVRAQALFAF